MRVLVVTNDFPPRVGGIQTYVHEILSRLDDEVTVLSSTSPGAEAFDHAYRHVVVRLPTSVLLPTAQTRTRVTDLGRAIRPDVIVFGASMPLALMGPSLQRRLGVPYVACTHGLEVAAARVPVWRAVLKHSLRHAACVTAVSSWTAHVLRAAIGPGPTIARLPNGVDAVRFRPEVSDALVRSRHGLHGSRVIGCVSRLVPRKGQDVLLTAFADIVRECADARLLIVGRGRDEARLRGLAMRLGIAARVVFAGEVPEAELPMYFRAADVFAMPCRSRWAGLEVEAFGAVFLQASAVGRPVVAGRSGGTSDAVVDGQTGTIVDGSDPEDVARAIRDLLSDPAKAAAMGARGAARAREHYSWDQIAAEARALLAGASA